MFEIELIILVITGVYTVVFFSMWYSHLFNAWPPERSRAVRCIFSWLPVLSFAIILYTLITLASFDVVESLFYIFFYIIIGFAWLHLGLTLMSALFDISWIDDGINLNNKAAVASIAGSFLGLAIIYAGSNIGDGPGWWCVFFACGLGFAAWFCCGLIINAITHVFERITVERDLSCGIRFGFYLLAAGVVLGRASAGDWTSAYMTIVEFMDGWPILPLTVLAVVIELYYIMQAKADYYGDEGHIISSVFWGIVYIVLAAVSVMLLPSLRENPVYIGLPEIFVHWGIIM